MTGPELKQLREDLGDAIGRRLSVADMAKICGLAPKNGADTWRKWEDGDGPSGPVSALMSILAYASDRRPVPSKFLEREVSLLSGDRVFIGPEIAIPVLRYQMRAEIIRRLA